MLYSKQNVVFVCLFKIYIYSSHCLTGCEKDSTLSHPRLLTTPDRHLCRTSEGMSAAAHHDTPKPFPSLSIRTDLKERRDKLLWQKRKIHNGVFDVLYAAGCHYICCIRLHWEVETQNNGHVDLTSLAELRVLSRPSWDFPVRNSDLRGVFLSFFFLFSKLRPLSYDLWLNVVFVMAVALQSCWGGTHCALITTHTHTRAVRMVAKLFLFIPFFFYWISLDFLKLAYSKHLLILLK